MKIGIVTKSELKPQFNSYAEIRRVVTTNSSAASIAMVQQDMLIRRMSETILELVAALEKQKMHTFRFFPIPFGCKEAFLTSPMFLDTEAAGKLLDEFNEVPAPDPRDQIKLDEPF